MRCRTRRRAKRTAAALVSTTPDAHGRRLDIPGKPGEGIALSTESRTGRIRRMLGSADRPGSVRTVAVPLAAALTGAFVVAGPVAAASATAAVANTHPAWAAASADRGTAAASTTLTPTVFYAGQDAPGMFAYAQAVSTPGNSLYRHYLTAAQYQARFGATTAQVAAVRSWLTGAGLKITSSNAAGVTVTGTAPAIQKAFGVSLHSYEVRGGSYVAPTADARAPAALAADVGTVTGLTTMTDMVRPSSLLGEVTTSLAKGVTGAKATVSKGADGATFLGPAQCPCYKDRSRTPPTRRSTASTSHTSCAATCPPSCAARTASRSPGSPARV